MVGTVTGYCCCCRERHVDGFDVRWIYITITTVLAAVIRFSRLSLSLSLSTVLLFSFLCVFFSTVFSFSFYTHPHFFLLLSLFFFNFPLTSSKVLHVRVCVRSFFSLVLARRRRSSTDLESNSQGRAAQLSEWRDQRCTALTLRCVLPVSSIQRSAVPRNVS